MSSNSKSAESRVQSYTHGESVSAVKNFCDSFPLTHHFPLTRQSHKRILAIYAELVKLRLCHILVCRSKPTFFFRRRDQKFRFGDEIALLVANGDRLAD